MLWQRLVFGTLLIAVIVGIVYVDGWLAHRAVTGTLEDATAMPPLAYGMPIMALILLLVVLTTYEMGGLCRACGYKPARHWAAFVGALLVVSPWVQAVAPPSDVGLAGVAGSLSLPAFLLLGGFLGGCLIVLPRKNQHGVIAAIAMTLMLIMYVGLLASFFVRIRCNAVGPAGAALVVWVIMTVKSGDIGAYFVGKALGKHKLAPWLSPGKTIEGAGGALVMSALVAAGGLVLWGRWAEVLGDQPMSLMQAVVFGGVMAICGHLGDLVESAIKRDAGFKDSGSLLPGFGGLLDLVDSPLFIAPIAWWWLTYWC